MNNSRSKCDRIADAISAKDLFLLEHLVADEPEIDRLRIEDEFEDYYSYSYTPLMVAVGRNWVEGVRFSIAKGSDLDAFDEEGETALHKAVACDLDEMVRILAAGTHPDISTANDRATPLIQAVRFGRTKVIRTLIEGGANIEYCWHWEDRTPLMLAIGNLRLENAQILEIAQILIEAGADVNAKSQGGETALEIARFRRNPEPIIQFLQDAGAIGDASLPDWERIAREF